MLVKEIMSHKTAFLQPEDTLRKAVRLFQMTHLEAVPVVDADLRVTGIFTRSHLYQGLLNDVGLDEPVGRFMNQHVVTLSPDMTFAQLTESLRSTPVGQAVVVTPDGRALGMITKVDVINALLDQTDRLSGELEGVVESLTAGIIAIDAFGSITLCNRAAEQILGRGRSEVVGKKITAFWPKSPLLTVLETGRVISGVKAVLGGTTLIANLAPISRDERVIGAVAVLQNLTDYEQVAEELQTTKRLSNTLETVLDLAYDGIVVVDERGFITRINRALARFLGVRQEEAVGRHIDEVIEDSRLPQVIREKTPQLNHVQVFKGTRLIVSRLPMVEGGRVVGAVAKIMFHSLDEYKDIARRLENLETQVAFYREQLNQAAGARYTFDSIITSHPAMEAVKRVAAKAAHSNSTVLLLGESGTGKELFAHAIHNASPRRRAPFIKVNCAAIPEELLESEFFGYAEGAFTGARKGGKPGKFELADGGTLFLDEIGDMSPGLQAKLLRVLQDGEFERVGGTRPVRVDVRIIAASNKNLEEMVARGEFREDLFYRLNVISLFVPPLRERREDILPLAHFFIRKYQAVTGSRVTTVSPAALAVLEAYSWPGNVRELENIIERALNLETGTAIQPDSLPPRLFGRSPAGGLHAGIGMGRTPDDEATRAVGFDKGVEAHRSALNPGQAYSRRPRGGSLEDRVRDAEREALLEALRRSGGNKAQAARALGVSRSWFYAKMKKHRLA